MIDQETNLPPLSAKPAIIVGMIILILLACTPIYYSYKKYQSINKTLSQFQSLPLVQSKMVVEKVREETDLPADEDPVIYHILDAGKVKDQPFFAKAKNGDLIIIYYKAKRAVLYDQKENRILESGPLILPEPTVPAVQEGSSSP